MGLSVSSSIHYSITVFLFFQAPVKGGLFQLSMSDPRLCHGYGQKAGTKNIYAQYHYCLSGNLRLVPLLLLRLLLLLLR